MVAEPLSIFSITFGLLAGFRNAVATISNDVREFGNHKVLTDSRAKKLDRLRDCLEKWRTRWMVWAEDKELFKYFWGAEEMTKIFEDLQGIDKQFVKLEKDVDVCLRQRKGSAFVKKTWYVLTKKGDDIDKRITIIGELIADLKSISDEAFIQEKYKDYRERPEPHSLSDSDIHEKGYKELLVRLARHTVETSDQLHRSCFKSTSKLELYLELDMFGLDTQVTDRQLSLKAVSSERSERSHSRRAAKHETASNREEAIAMSAVDIALRYTFISKDIENSESWVRLRATSANVENGNRNARPFFVAQRDIVSNGDERNGLRLENNGHLVVLRQEIGNIRGDIPDPVTLRHVLDTPLRYLPPQHPPSSNFAEILRLRRACLLVEFGMLFLQTSWIHCICSCNISQLRIDANAACREEDLYRYILKIPRPGHTHPVDPSGFYSSPPSGHNPSVTCWCPHKAIEGSPNLRTKFEDYPLFYLGLILIEVKLDALISKVSLADTALIARDSLRLTYAYRNLGTGARIEQSRMLENLQELLGKPYYDVVVYCLERTWTCRDIPQYGLKTYYSTVLYP